MDEKLLFGPAGEPSFVALGDSFTEGLNDAVGLEGTGPGGGFRGWADRLAGLLAAEYSGVRYANLAVRGKLLRQIVADQVPVAAEMGPGLVSIAGGGNDILRPGADPDVLAELFDAAVARLRAGGSQVLMFTGFDPVSVPVLRLLRGKIGTFNMHLRGIADARDCYLVDLWSMRFLRSADAWSPDRLHLTAQSHQRVALRACEVLGVPVSDDWRAPLAADEVPATLLPDTVSAALTRGAWLAARRADARWARDYLGPWLNRRLRGTSSGDGVTAKRPFLEPVPPPGARWPSSR
jgi:lysophospholipase L1-like esterase